MLRAERSSYHYRGCRADQADLKKRMREIAETRVRYGYRRIHVLLRREGWDVNAKRIYRLYKEMGLQLRQKPPNRRVKAKLREGRCAASCSNEVWAMDFVHDQLATGSKLRILTVIDTFSRFSPAVVPRFSFRAPDVIEVLDRVCGEVGYPASIRVDQGSEFVSRELDLWAYTRGVILAKAIRLLPSAPRPRRFAKGLHPTRFSNRWSPGVISNCFTVKRPIFSRWR